MGLSVEKAREMEVMLAMIDGNGNKWFSWNRHRMER